MVGFELMKVLFFNLSLLYVQPEGFVQQING